MSTGREWCRQTKVSVTLSLWNAHSLPVLLNFGVALIADTAGPLTTCNANFGGPCAAFGCTGRHAELELRILRAFENALRCLDAPILLRRVPQEARRTIASKDALFRTRSTYRLVAHDWASPTAHVEVLVPETFAAHALMFGNAVAPRIADKTWSTDAVARFVQFRCGCQVTSAKLFFAVTAKRWHFKATALRRSSGFLASCYGTKNGDYENCYMLHSASLDVV